MVLRGRVTVRKDGSLWVIKVGDRDAFFRNSRAAAVRKANIIRREQGKAKR